MTPSSTPSAQVSAPGSPSAPEACRYPHPFRILLGPLIAAFSGLYSEAALNIALPSLMGVFDIPATVVQWLTTGYILAVGVVLPMFGLLVRWIPTRKLVVTAIVLFLVGATIAATAPSFAILLTGRIIQGVATGIMLPLVFNTAIAVYPVSRTGTAMGTIGLVVMFAPTVSPVIAGLLLDRLDWTWIFWSMVPVLLGALLISLVFLKDVRELSRPKVDALSLVLSTVGFGGLVLGLSLGGDSQWKGIEGPAAIIIGLLAIGFFAHRQIRHDHPMLDIRSFRVPTFTLSTVVIFINNAIMMGAIFLLPMYLQDAKGTTVLAAGLLMLPGGLVNGVMSAISGRISDVVNPRVLIRLGLAASVVATALLSVLDADSPLFLAVVAHCVLMIGIPLTMTPTQTLGLRSLPPILSSDGSTIISTLQQIGAATGTALGASLLAAGMLATSGDAAAAVATGTRWGFLFCMGCAICALVLTLGIRTPRAPVQGPRASGASRRRNPHPPRTGSGGDRAPGHRGLTCHHSRCPTGTR